ncbi:MAG: N-acyl homoserine lactonase family protein [Solirubrobacteraceae bacterium]
MTTTSPAPVPLRPGSEGACVEVDLLPCGHSLAPPGWFYRQDAGGSWRRALGIGVPKEQWLRSPIGAFLVRHPSVGPFLIDTGLHADAATNLRKDFGVINAFAFSTLRMRPENAVAAQLPDRGVQPGDIDLVVMTHLHVDHTSGMRDFPTAEFVCSEEEWRATRGRGAVLRGYVAHHLPDAGRMRTLSFQGAAGHGPFSRTLDLFGDGSVRLVFTPGHTLGHLAVLVRLRGGEALLAGDAIYTRRNLTESLISWRTADDAQFMSSLQELRGYAAENPDVPIVPTHDAGVWDALSELR